MEWLEFVFGAEKDVSWAQMCARAALILVYGVVLVRLAGRRVFGKWSALDIVVSIVVGPNLSRALTGTAPLWSVLAATTVMLALHWMLARLAARFPAVSRVLEGEGVVIAREGKLYEAHLAREAVSAADLTEALRQQGVEDVKQTRLVMLEPSGRITVLGKE